MFEETENQYINPDEKNNRPGKPFLIILITVLSLAVISFIPWGKLTNNFLKDFSLLSDLFPGAVKVVAEELIDPELAAALSEEEESIDTAVNNVVDTSQTTDGKKVIGTKLEETVAVAVSMPTADQVKPRMTSRQGDKVLIEDYTINSTGLVQLRHALANNSSRPARIAVIGDSYIEGDILTSNLRANLQDIYGGSGVGYIPLQSDLTGFRITVSERCSGWTVHDIRKSSDDAYKALSGEYFVSGSSATTSASGSSRMPHLSSWSSTKFLFIAPTDAQITISAAGNTETYDVESSSDVQCLSISGNTSTASVKCSTSGVIGLGLYLDGSSGIAVDCMSLRGNSGISHRKLSAGLATQMRNYIDYDLIIVEYGINALSSQQSNYSGYKKLMFKVITRLKACYPNADILIMGIGDRGQKIGGTVKSIPTAQNMVDVQRDLARETGCLFWDTREAMGGEDAVVEWRNNGWVNPDYIHLNSKGGRELGEKLTHAILEALK